MDTYVGKKCNRCGLILKEDDEVIICPACLKPHHTGCWIDFQGCATPGCIEQSPEEKKKYVQAQKARNKRIWGTVAAVAAAFILGVLVGSNTDLTVISTRSTRSTQSSGNYSSTWTPSTNKVVSESQIKSAAIAAAKTALAAKKRSWSGDIDTETSYYYVSKIEKMSSGYKVYGTVSLKDSYGNYVRKYWDGSGGFSADWSVTVDENGKAGVASMN